MVTSGEGWGKGIVREFGEEHVHTAICQMITKKDLLYSNLNSGQCSVTTYWEKAT